MNKKDDHYKSHVNSKKRTPMNPKSPSNNSIKLSLDHLQFHFANNIFKHRRKEELLSQETNSPHGNLEFT